MPTPGEPSEADAVIRALGAHIGELVTANTVLQHRLDVANIELTALRNTQAGA